MNKIIHILLFLAQGSCVLEYREEGGLNLDMVGWRGTRSLRAYVPSSDCVHFIRILGGDASKFGNCSILHTVLD